MKEQQNKQETYTNLPNNILRLLLESKISKPALKLYIFLRMYRNNDSGIAWPSVRRIVDEAHINRRDVKSSRDELIELGIISIEKSPGENVRVSFKD